MILKLSRYKSGQEPHSRLRQNHPLQHSAQAMLHFCHSMQEKAMSNASRHDCLKLRRHACYASNGRRTLWLLSQILLPAAHQNLHCGLDIPEHRRLYKLEPIILNAKDILAKLTSFNTISSESNLPLIEWMEQYLGGLGIYHERLADPDGQLKASLIARVGPENTGGLIFSGHTDVVPVAKQPWTADPFTMREENGKYIGRGVCDMKGFLACMLANAPRWQAQTLKAPIYFAFSYDEEVGCDKAPPIAERIKALGGADAYAIIGEPTLLCPVVSHKGITTIRTTLTGSAAHSSQILHQGVSAIHEAGKLVAYIERVMYDLIADGELDEHFNVPHSSLHVGMIHGGIAHNVLARECTLDWEIRNLPSQTLESVLQRVEAYAKKLTDAQPLLSIRTELTSPPVPGLENRCNSGLLALIKQHLPEKTPEYVAYGTEAGYFQQAGFESIILGPGSISQAHQPDEWIDISQIEQCTALLQQLVNSRCA